MILSIALSAVATLLILIGWGRRLRLESEGEPRAVEEVHVEDIDFIELGVGAEDEPVRPRRRRRVKAVRAVEEEPIVELPEDAEVTYELPEIAEPVRTRKSPGARSRPQREEYVGLDDLAAVPAKTKRRSAAAAPAPAKSRARAAPKANRVVIVPGRGRYHRSSCRFARRPEAKEVTVATARRRGYEPCSVCDPDET